MKQFLCMLIFCSAAVPAQITSGGGNAYMFRAKYTKGQVFKYTMNVNVTGPQAFKQAMSMNTKVVDIKANGDVTLTTTTNIPGQKPMTQTAQFDKSGKPKNNQFGGFNGSLGLPEKPVKIGESWSGDVSMAGGMAGGAPIRAKYTFKRITTIGNAKVAQIDFSMDMKSVMGMVGSGSSFMKLSDGQLQKAVIDMSMDVPDPKSKKATKTKMSMILSLVK